MVSMLICAVLLNYEQLDIYTKLKNIKYVC